MSHYKEKANQKFVVTTEHRHVKNIWEIVYYINYEGVFVLGDKEIPYEKNTVMLIPPNVMHYEFSTSAIELYFITFKPVLEHNPNGFAFRDYSSHFFENMFAQCFYLKNSKPINWQSNLSMVLGCIEQYLASLESIGEISIAEQLKQRISERFTDSSLQIGQLLEEMPLSAWYQRKLFKEATGMTLTQYLNKIVISGEGAYSRLKFESGVHRVQRVPETENMGRIHTSTVTVAVLPEAQEVDVEINPSDLQIDTFRSSGAGGQHVNKTESAIRITHIPTGTVVECQDERSQYKNKDRAMKILRSRILEAERRKQSEAIAGERRAQVGTGDRSERIRTYNYPQGRVTDHRIGLTLYRLEAILNGDLDELIDALITADTAEKLRSTDD